MSVTQIRTFTETGWLTGFYPINYEGSSVQVVTTSDGAMLATIPHGGDFDHNAAIVAHQAAAPVDISDLTHIRVAMKATDSASESETPGVGLTFDDVYSLEPVTVGPLSQTTESYAVFDVTGLGITDAQRVRMDVYSVDTDIAVKALRIEGSTNGTF